MKINKLARTMMLAAAGTLLFTLTASAQALPPAQPPVARIWIYHELNPDGRSRSLMSGSTVRSSAPLPLARPSTVICRRAGTEISVESYVDDGNQTKIVDLVPGSQVYAKIVPFGDIVQGGGEFGGGYHRNTYYLWLYPPELAQPVIARGQIVGSRGAAVTAAFASPRNR